MEVRKTFNPRPTWPLFFAIAVDAVGNPVKAPQMRQKVDRLREKAGLQRRVNLNAFRATYAASQAAAKAPVEIRLAGYLQEDFFFDRYPMAAQKWREAAALAELGLARHASDIGLDCREALDAFANEVTARYRVKARGSALEKLRAALSQEVESDTVKASLKALVTYCGTVNELANRQVHVAKREGDALTAEDGRRALFQTLNVMCEVVRSLLRTADSS
jgi:hypothetical protein